MTVNYNEKLCPCYFVIGTYIVFPVCTPLDSCTTVYTLLINKMYNLNRSLHGASAKHLCDYHLPLTKCLVNIFISGKVY